MKTAHINYDIEFNITTVPRGTVYTIQSGGFRNTAQSLFSFITSLILATSILRIYQWHNRQKKISSNGVVSVDIAAITIKSIVCLCHSLALFIFPFITCISTYWLVFGEVQHTIFVFRGTQSPPSNVDSLGSDEYKVLVITVQILFWSHTLYMLSAIYKQCNIDIFFIDWEKNRGMGMGVSMWRVIMISQEWNKLQAARRTNIEINIVVLVFIMLTLIKTHPFELDFPHNENFKAITHIILSIWIWTCSTGLQLLWRNLVVERYCSESVTNHFIDYSSITKISTLIMDEAYHGFYIHCRSSYEFADCTNEELHGYMDKESRGIYAHRGLDDPAAPRDCQAFVLMATAIFRRQINKAIHAPQSHAARAELDSFLKSFIEQTPPPLHEGLRRKIRIASLCEKMIGVSSSETRTHESGCCVLFPDEKTCISDFSFLNTTFLGIERDLFLQDVLTYSFSLTIRNDMGIAVLFTYLMHLLRYFIRMHFGRRNISKKGFIDVRLLC